jgi:hypothetical protein
MLRVARPYDGIVGRFELSAALVGIDGGVGGESVVVVQLCLQVLSFPPSEVSRMTSTCFLVSMGQYTYIESDRASESIRNSVLFDAALTMTS